MFSLLVSSLDAANWPAWRGPNGDGIVEDKSVPTEWSATKNVKWRIELPDRGNSTPIVWGGKVFITQAIEKEGKRQVVAYSRVTGEKLWEQGTIYKQRERTHRTNPYCSATPVTDGERIIALFGSAGLFCYDLNGKELWRRDFGKQDYEWGNGSSPLLHGDLCILYYGPGANARMISVNKRTGKTAWEWKEGDADPAGRTDGFRGNEPGMICTYGSPIIARHGGRDELVMTFPNTVRAFDPESGKELWHSDGLNPLIYASPIFGEGVTVSMGGYFGTSIAVAAGGKGDVTGSHRLWQKTRTANRIGSGIILKGHVYIFNSDGFLDCIELKTGREVYSERVRGKGAKSESWSSMVLVGDLLYQFNQSGDTLIMRASPKFELVAVNSIGNELTNSSPAISDGEIFIRTHKHLWCISGRKLTAGR